ncbi:MAG: hypothetical protein HY863_15635 [Chloroflexi bacterium]|nr:hypothetical protein [Chloroflexota bacterium]
MPAYNFQKQFVQMILDKSKTHTIRRRRKRPTKPRDMLMLYTGMRTKSCKLVAVTKCVKVESILLKLDKSEVWIWSPEEPGDLYYQEGEDIGSFRLMTVEEVNALAHADGFEDVYDFFDFFKQYKSDYLDDFEIIHWDTDLIVVNGNGKAGEVRLLGGA